jgi:hypothetical protein
MANRANLTPGGVDPAATLPQYRMRALTFLFTGKISETCLTSLFVPKGSANAIAVA